MRRTGLGAALLAVSMLAPGGCGVPAERNMSTAEVAGQLATMRIDSGLWEISSEVVDARGPDLPVEIRNRMVGPRPTIRHCITPAQAEHPDANFLARGDHGCAYRELVVEDGQIRGTTICPEATMRMTGRYGPRAYDMRMQRESPVPAGGNMILELRTRGRRIGACPQGGKQ